jgi:hypothetical protein
MATPPSVRPEFSPLLTMATLSHVFCMAAVALLWLFRREKLLEEV